MLKDILEIVCVISLFGKLIADTFASALSKPQELVYGGFELSTTPIYSVGDERHSPIVHGLSTVFVFHLLFRPPILLVVDQGNPLAPLLLLNLAVGYAFGVSYLYDGLLGRFGLLTRTP